MVTKPIFSALDTAQKPHYFGDRNPHASAVFTTSLLGLASVRSTRASAASGPPRGRHPFHHRFSQNRWRTRPSRDRKIP